MNRALFEMAQPLRLKLLESVMPTVTEGLIKVSIHNYVTSALFVY